jgi:hypothetical protein
VSSLVASKIFPDLTSMTASPPPPDRLPRLCYLGSVPVEPSAAGMMLLHRLLAAYPAERLAVGLTAETPTTRLPAALPGVRTFSVPKLFHRGWVFGRRRAPGLFLRFLHLHAHHQARVALRHLGDFRPDAILTVHEKFGAFPAQALAARLGVPLHLILHDEWHRDMPMPTGSRVRFENAFRQLYTSAASRLCVCPYMEEDYAVRYGRRGSILYPYRARDAVAASIPPPQVGQADTPLTVAYGGTVCSDGYWNALRALAAALRGVGGRLILFGPNPADVAAQGLVGEHVVARGYSRTMMSAMRAEANVLFLPMAFEASEEANARVSFPSKLTEYTATGLPLLIYGPPYASAVRWAQSHPGTSEVVATPGEAALAPAVLRLREPAHRTRLAAASLELGDTYFNFDRAERLFHQALTAA